MPTAATNHGPPRTVPTHAVSERFSLAVQFLASPHRCRVLLDAAAAPTEVSIVLTLDEIDAHSTQRTLASAAASHGFALPIAAPRARTEPNAPPPAACSSSAPPPSAPSHSATPATVDASARAARGGMGRMPQLPRNLGFCSAAAAASANAVASTAEISSPRAGPGSPVASVVHGALSHAADAPSAGRRLQLALCWTQSHLASTHQSGQGRHLAPSDVEGRGRSKKASAAFKKMDRNGDGRLSRAEVIQALRKDAEVRELLGLEEFETIRQEDGSRDAFEKVFQALDADSSKLIDEREFCRFFERVCGEESHRQGYALALSDVVGMWAERTALRVLAKLASSSPVAPSQVGPLSLELLLNSIGTQSRACPDRRLARPSRPRSVGGRSAFVSHPRPTPTQAGAFPPMPSQRLITLDFDDEATCELYCRCLSFVHAEPAPCMHHLLRIREEAAIRTKLGRSAQEHSRPA